MGEPCTKPPKLAVADLFCGAGGLSAGFQAAGFESVFALDKDADSCLTYERNFGFAPEHASITAFDPSDLAGKLTDVDVIVGGPSCQTFSTQGRRFTWADPNDERTKLWRNMLALVDEVRPRAFLLENVPGLSHKGLAYEKDGRAQGEIVTHFANLGYTLRAAILLAADYGVPQLRRRLFVVGVEEGVEFEFPSPTHLGGWRRDTAKVGGGAHQTWSSPTSDIGGGDGRSSAVAVGVCTARRVPPRRRIRLREVDARWVERGSTRPRGQEAGR